MEFEIDAFFSIRLRPVYPLASVAWPLPPPAPLLNPGCLFLCPLITSAGPRVLPEHREVKQLVLRHNAALAEKCFQVNIKEEDCIAFSCY